MAIRFLSALALVGMAALSTGARAQEPVALVFEPRLELPERQDAGRRLAGEIAAGLPDMVVATPMPATRGSALLDAGAQVCAVMHARSPKREHTRQWVSEISRSMALLVSAERGRGQPGRGDTVVALGGTPYEEMARQLGVAVEVVKTRAQIYQMFKARRLQYWVEDKRVLDKALMEGEIGSFHVVRELAELSGWVACSLGVPDQVVRAIGLRLEALRADGTVDRILEDAGQKELSEQDTGMDAGPSDAHS